MHMKKHFGFQSVPAELRERVVALMKEGKSFSEAIKVAMVER